MLREPLARYRHWWKDKIKLGAREMELGYPMMAF
jgi:hypothetical protein